MIDVISDEAFERVKLILHGVPGGAEMALKGIISRATGTVRKTALEGITSVYDIALKDVRDRKHTTINMRTKQTGSGIVGEITFSGVKIPLIRFGVSHKSPKSRGVVPVNFNGQWLIAPRAAPVKARERRDTPMQNYEEAFVAVAPNAGSGHTGIFKRMGIERLKIKELVGASTAQMAGNSVVLEKVEAAAVETIVKRTEHEISRILHGYGGK